MPILVPSYVSIPGQVNQQAQAPSTQNSLRQMIGEVLFWNPEFPPLMARQSLQNAYRSIIDSRLYYGLMVRGQLSVPQAYSTGSATFTAGSATVAGTGTAWTLSMVGAQIRSGFSTGFYNIAAVNPTAQVITLDLPWANATVTNAGYSILQTWVTLGPNIKYVLEMVNQRQGYRLALNLPQKALNTWDAWRTTTGWTLVLANKEPSAAGWPQYELWPAPTTQQAFPFLAYVQPPDLVNDSSFPATFIRSDIIVREAIHDALLFGGPKKNPYYDPETAKVKHMEYLAEVENLKKNDDNQYSKDLTSDFSRWKQPGGPGSLWAQMHEDVPA